MQKYLFLLILTCLVSASAFTQEKEVKLKSAEISWGDSAFTSGLDTSFLFSLKNDSTLQIVGNHERFYTVLGLNVFKNKLFLNPTGGIFKKLPWAGPQVIYYPVKPVMLMYWGGYSAGRVGELKPAIKSFCQNYSIYVTPEKHISIGYTVIKFDAYKTNQLPEAAYSYWLKDSIRLKVSSTYDVNQKKPLFCLSLMYTPSKK
jgi:hypothetical protein